MKTERIKTIGKIKGTSYRNTSYFGNPSYYVSFENEEGETIKGYTAPNAACLTAAQTQSLENLPA